MTAFAKRLAPAIALVLGLGLLLAACSQPPQEEEPRPETVDFEINELPDSPVTLGALFVMADFSSGPMSAASVIEIEPGAFVGPLVGLNDDGSISPILPDAEEVPAATLTGAAEFLLGFTESCTVVASNPAAQVSQTMFELLSIPGFFAVTIEGLTPTYVTTEPITEPATFDDLYGYTYVGWIFADRAVDVSTDPPICVTSSDFEVGVDLQLQAGWNQIEWTIGQDDPMSSDATGLYLANGDHEGLHLTPMPFFLITASGWSLD